MGTQNSLVRAVLCGLLVSGLAGAGLSASAQQPANPEKNVEVANSVEPGRTSPTELAAEQAKVEGLPDSPGANLSNQKSEGAGFATLMVAQNQPSQSQSTQPQSPQTSSNSTQPNQNSAPDAQKPVGTAAAEAPHTTGVAASQPAGVAIAPAKQHRVRTIVIRVGAIVGAGVAVGTVIALTEGTSGKPPGAH
ncbi:MAG: hypothetical protein WAN65_19355 [Candidatus Sulfotelmatobacter sp.]